MQNSKSFEIRYSDLTPVFEGIVIAPVIKLIREIDDSNIPKKQLGDDNEVNAEIAKVFKTAEVLIHLEENYLKDGNVVSDIESISRSYIMMIKEIREKMIKEIQEKRINAEYAVINVIRYFSERLEKIRDDYFQERIHDFSTIRNRFISHLMGKSYGSTEEILNMKRETGQSFILVSDEIMPSDFSLIKKGIVSGIIHGKGGRTSHIAIIARSLEIPTIVGAEKILSHIRENELLILDSYDGMIYINPEPATLMEYQKKKEKKEKKYLDLIQRTKSQPAQTLDQVHLTVMANVEVDSDLEKIYTYGAEGIGLYRTEFLYIDNEDSKVSFSVFMDEEQQFEVYKKLAVMVNPKPVVIRTFDIGRNHIKDEKIEKNPFLGLRSIRYCLVNSGLFKTQLRAILRASHYGYVRILIPMISNLDEIKMIKMLIEEVKRELMIEGTFFDEDIEVGVMIEIPAAAMIIDLIASLVDFISIGTNDLLQYTLAVDRSSPDLSYLYNPYSLSFLRIIDYAVKRIGNKPLYVCGEIASDPLFVIFFTGIGIRSLSVNIYDIPKVKDLLGNIKASECEALAEEIMTVSNDDEIRKKLKYYYNNSLERD